VVRGLVALLALGLAQSAAAEPPLCRAEVVLEPARAFVGQPVRHRVRITKRHEVVDVRWETSLSFPAFRAERILGPGGPRERDAAGETFEERRVLFPARAGRLALPAARIACESATRVETARVPAAEVVAEEPPAAGRPPGWAGLIGPVEVSVYATPDRVALGESVSLTVTVQGETNVWTAPIAFPFPPDEAEVFERPSDLSRDMGRSLGLRWHRGFDLVPRRAGRLEIPALAVAYFDPATGRYGEAHTPALAIEVGERAAAASLPAPEPEAAAAATEGGDRGWLVWLAIGLAGALGLGAALLARRRLAPRRGAAERCAARDALAAALARADAADAAAAASRLLRLGLEPALPDARSLAVEEIRGRAPSAEAARVALLARLEQARFGGAGDAALLGLAREAAEADR
jgi:hypothetical protein